MDEEYFKFVFTVTEKLASYTQLSWTHTLKMSCNLNNQCHVYLSQRKFIVNRNAFYANPIKHRWVSEKERDLSTSGSSSSEVGNPVCGGCEGTPAGREGSVACPGMVWHASHTPPPRSRALHALQDHSKNGLEYLQTHRKSFHAWYLRHRYKNA